MHENNYRYLQHLGWGVTIGAVVLLVGAVIYYFVDLSETKKEKAKRLAQDTARKDARLSG